MKVRADSVLIASVLFTVALLSLVPPSLANALTGHNKMALATLDTGFREVARMTGDLGIVCLAMILIGLIVTWTGYIKQARSAWFVMFVLTWAWAFPLLVLPWFSAHWVVTFPELLYSAIHESAVPRFAVESVLIFLLMVIALLLPLRSFFGRGTAAPMPSPNLVGVSVVTLLVLVIALLVWVHTRVYEIPPEMLKLWQQMPPPPPPPR
ncbi:MAG: hypothetical protein ACHP8B_02270 [Terriglobales bacterium]